MAWDKPNAARDRIFGAPARRTYVAPLRFTFPAMRAAAGDAALAASFIMAWVAADRLPFELVSGVTVAFQFEIIALLATLVAGAISLTVAVMIGESDTDSPARRAGFTALRVLIVALVIYLFLVWFLKNAPSAAADSVFIIALLAVALNRAWNLIDQPGPILIYLGMYLITVAVVHPVVSRMLLPPLGLTQEVTVALVNSSFAHPWALEEYLLIPGGYMLTAALFYAGAALLTVMGRESTATQAGMTVTATLILSVATWTLAKLMVSLVTGTPWTGIGREEMYDGGMWTDLGGALIMFGATLLAVWTDAETPDQKRTLAVIMLFQALVAMAAIIGN